MFGKLFTSHSALVIKAILAVHLILLILFQFALPNILDRGGYPISEQTQYFFTWLFILALIWSLVKPANPDPLPLAAFLQALFLLLPIIAIGRLLHRNGPLDLSQLLESLPYVIIALVQLFCLGALIKLACSRMTIKYDVGKENAKMNISRV